MPSESTNSITAAIADLSAKQPQTRRVCWVTEEMVGFFKNGGAGTVVTGFCLALAEAGHDVTVLYMGHVDRRHPSTEMALTGYQAKKINIIFLQDIVSTSGAPAERSYRAHEWLSQHSFDIIHFHEFNGYGFFATNAKRQGLAYENSLLCMTIFGSSRWGWECLEHYLQSPDELERDFIERGSVARADVVLCHSHYMKGWLQRNRFELPAATYVQPSIIPDPSLGRERADLSQTPIREIVFFGRQEVRKGMRIFVEALSILAPQYPNLRFTFLGKFSQVDQEHSGAYVLSRLASVCNDISFITNYDRDQAIRYLKRGDVLAVMPSADDNFPGTVIEAITEQLEFIASDRGGIPEIIHPEDRKDRLFSFSGPALAAKIVEVMKHRPPPARLGYDISANTTAWMKWHARVPTAARATPREDRRNRPFVSVCIVHYNRPGYLKFIIDSLKAQTYTNFEAVIVDDGSPGDAAKKYLALLETERFSFPLRIVRTDNIWLGAARNAGAAAAKGEYLIFVDDDNTPKPNMIETLVRVALLRDLDIATCLANLVHGDKEPGAEDDTVGYFPTGGPVSTAMINNTFGDANALFRKSVFDALKGFDPTPHIGAEDWDLFVRASLAGYKIEVVAKPCYYYRVHAGQLTARPHSTNNYYERLVRRYSEALAGSVRDDLHDALRLIMGRFAVERVRGISWYALGQRPFGEYERQLVPHAFNDVESHRLLTRLAIAMGRPRDAANMIIQSGEPLGALIDPYFDRSASFVPAVVQGSIPLPLSVLSSVEISHIGTESKYANNVVFNSQSKSILVHPIDKHVCVGVLRRAFLPGMQALKCRVSVDHHRGPVVRFTLAVTPAHTDTRRLSKRLTDNYAATASVEVAPGETEELVLKLDERSVDQMDIVLATQSDTHTSFAWAHFKGFVLV